MKTLVLGLVLLAANIVAAHAEDRKCIREMYELYGDHDGGQAPMRSKKLRHQSE